jgi:hypothetical protein
MSEMEDGGPAFPGFDYVAQDGKVNPSGMTLRDWFAGQALAGLLAAVPKDTPWLDTDHLASLAYDAADAMLTARKETP